MVKIRVTSKGIIQEPGSGFELGGETDHSDVLPFKQTTQAKTADFTLTSANAGLLTISGSSVLTGTMPAAADAAGAMFTFRNLSTGHEHTLTGSDSGTRSFVYGAVQGHGGESNVTGSSGSRLRLGTVVGSSVALMCDGASYLILGSSGSVVLDQA